MLFAGKIFKLVIVSIFLGGTLLMGETPDENKRTSLNGDSSNCGVITPSRTFIISDSELSRTMLTALQGNPDDAFRVMLHFKVGLNNRSEGVEWMNIGAENGHLEAQYALANILLNFSDDYYSEVRGIFWLYEMAKNGYRETVDWLQDLNLTLETAEPPDDSYFADDLSQFSEITTVIEDYKIGALQGNKKAALVLGKYFEEIKKDKDSFQYWYRIGAQNGSPECQYKLGQIMGEEEDESYQTRGRYWLDRAKKNDYKI
jgi:TPR repeat protein